MDVWSKNFSCSNQLGRGISKAILLFLAHWHVSSCFVPTHAHQQNGSGKQKHHHIIEVGLSLLAQSSMPLNFWDETFITAAYLINRLLSKVIQNDTPFERLFHQPPN